MAANNIGCIIVFICRSVRCGFLLTLANCRCVVKRWRCLVLVSNVHALAHISRSPNFLTRNSWSLSSASSSKCLGDRDIPSTSRTHSFGRAIVRVTSLCLHRYEAVGKWFLVIRKYNKNHLVRKIENRNKKERKVKSGCREIMNK